MVELLGREPRTALGVFVGTDDDLRTEPRTAFDVLEDVEAIFCELDLMVGCEDTRDVEMVVLVDLLDTLGFAHQPLLPCASWFSLLGLHRKYRDVTS